MSSAILVVTLLAQTLHADAVLHDKVELLTGEVYYGRVIRLTDYEVSIELSNGGVLSFRRSRIRLVTARGGPLNAEQSRREALRSLFELGKPLPSSPTTPTETLPSINPRALPRLEVPELPLRALIEVPPPEKDPSAPKEQGPTPPGEKGVVVEDYHFSVIPPPGFARVRSEETDSNVVLRYRDPLTNALFIVAAYPTDERLVTLKARLNKSALAHFEGYEIKQDVPLTVSGHQAWLVEIESRLGDVTLHQLQLLARAHENILILTYLATKEQREHYKKAFETSAKSLRVLPRSDAGLPEEAGGDSPASREQSLAPGAPGEGAE